MKALLKIALPATLILFLSFAMNLRSKEIIKVWNQPEDIDYNNYNHYSLAVIRAHRNWLTLGQGRNYEIFVGRKAAVGEYGHFASFSFSPALRFHWTPKWGYNPRKERGVS